MKAYLKERQAKKDAVRQEIQAKFPTDGLRERLMKRREQKES